MEKQRARTAGEKLERRELILAAAKSQFSAHGFRGATIRTIADAAGLTPGTVYQYFDSKLSLYRTLSLAGLEALEGLIAASGAADFGSSADGIKALAGAYLRFFEEKRELYDIIVVDHLGVADFFEDLRLVPELERRTGDLLTLLASLIEKGADRGEFRRVDARKTATTLWGLIDGVLMLEVKRSTGFVGYGARELFWHAVDLALAALSVGADPRLRPAAKARPSGAAAP